MKFKALFNPLYRYFLNGLIIIAPVALTLMIIAKILQFLDQLIGDFIPIHIPGVGIISGVILIIICGWLSSYFFLKSWISHAEQLLSSIPLVKSIFKVVKQIQSALFDNKHFFKDAVLIPYPINNSYALGFIMTDLSDEIRRSLPENYICVFIPFSINMTTGTNLFINRDTIIPLEVTTESAIQFFLSAGAVMPNNNTKKEV
ncbi:MAG: DUF502 domain-containing protein [Negativicutes bacterium]